MLEEKELESDLFSNNLYILKHLLISLTFIFNLVSGDTFEIKIIKNSIKVDSMHSLTKVK